MYAVARSNIAARLQYFACLAVALRGGGIDEYEFIVHPRLAGRGPRLACPGRSLGGGGFAGLSKHIDLKLVSQLQFGTGAVAMRYQPRR